MAENDGVVEPVNAPAGEAVPEVVPPLIEKTPEPAPDTQKAERLITKAEFDNRQAKLKYKYERQIQEEREHRIRLEERLAQHAPKEQPKADGRPDLKDFTDFGEYTAAMAKWVTKQELQATLAEREKQSAAEKANAAQAQTAVGWQKKVSAALKDIPDLNEVLAEATDVPMPRHVEQAIMESDEGPRLAYYLATHPEEAFRIANMTPNGAVRALTLIEVGFQKKPVTATPAPITPIGSRPTSGPKALTTPMSQSEFERRREAYIARNGRR